jgi:hypothetical protein
LERLNNSWESIRIIAMQSEERGTGSYLLAWFRVNFNASSSLNLLSLS